MADAATLRELGALGLSVDQIAGVVEIMERRANSKRAAARERMRLVRERARTEANSGEHESTTANVREHSTPVREPVSPKEIPPTPPKEITPSLSDRESTSQHVAGFDKPAAGLQANGHKPRDRYPAWFEPIWAAYRPIASPNSSKSRALTAAKRLSEEDRAACLAGLPGYVAWLRAQRAKRSDFPAQHLATWINGRGWEAFTEKQAQAPPAVSDAEMRRIIDSINAEREEIPDGAATIHGRN